jgi:AraC-like DNA-binding protein
MDALTSLLSLVRVEGGIFCRAELSAPWGVSTRGAGVAIFHVVVAGEGEAVCEEEAVAFRAGDVVLFPRGSAHVMRSGPDAAVVPIRELPTCAEEGLDCVRSGGSGAPTSLLCGTLRFGAEAETLLLPHLPTMLRASAGRWTEVTLAALAEEARRGLPGGEFVRARLAEVLIVQALRTWAGDGARTGWLRALADPQLARAMAEVHAEPAGDWTSTALARKAGMSRSAFYTRFTETVGEPPAAWVERWRMAVARRALREGRAGVAEVAARVGYGSETAFSRAFRRHVGVSPRQWRRSA